MSVNPQVNPQATVAKELRVRITGRMLAVWTRDGTALRLHPGRRGLGWHRRAGAGWSGPVCGDSCRTRRKEQRDEHCAHSHTPSTPCWPAAFQALLLDVWVIFGRGSGVTAEVEHGQGDQGVERADAEREPGDESDLGVDRFDGWTCRVRSPIPRFKGACIFDETIALVRAGTPSRRNCPPTDPLHNSPGSSRTRGWPSRSASSTACRRGAHPVCGTLLSTWRNRIGPRLLWPVMRRSRTADAVPARHGSRLAGWPAG